MEIPFLRIEISSRKLSLAVMSIFSFFFCFGKKHVCWWINDPLFSTQGFDVFILNSTNYQFICEIKLVIICSVFSNWRNENFWFEVCFFPIFEQFGIFVWSKLIRSEIFRIILERNYATKRDKKKIFGFYSVANSKNNKFAKFKCSFFASNDFLIFLKVQNELFSLQLSKNMSHSVTNSTEKA